MTIFTIIVESLSTKFIFTKLFKLKFIFKVAEQIRINQKKNK